jgi:hypothetical protein
LSTIHVAGKPRFTAVFTSPLFISMEPSPTIATALQPLPSAAPSTPVAAWPMEPRLVLTR